MSAALSGEIDAFMSGLKQRNPNEPEFHQAAREIIESVYGFVADHDAYRRAKILERITEPDRAISFRVAWQDDQGGVHVNKGYRVQFNNSIGPYKGGLRFHPTVTLSVLKFLGFEQIFKNALTGLPMGGGKGGSNFNPKGRSDDEVMRFCHSFMTELWRHIGPSTDVPAGDIGVGGREIGYLFGQYKRLANEWSGTFTGKGRTYGGSLIRPEATGYGCVYFLQNMLETRGESMDGKTVLVSGSGNVAQYATEKCIELGAKVVTLSDSGGFIHDPAGVDAEKLAFVLDLKNNRRGRISEYAERFGCEYYAGHRPWGIKADMALPCATQNEIDLSDAQAMLANGVYAVSEGANMPTSLDAVHALLEAKILFAPGKAANAGGVAVSGLEQSQNAIRLSWSRADVDERLKGIMKNIHTQCAEHGTQGNFINYVDGANIAGLKKVAESMLAYGVM
jgi:glutamate dehydrogenase (NADP+)